MTDPKAYIAPRIFDGENWHEDAALVVKGGIIRGISPRGALAAGLDVEDLGAGFLAPGFVDLQVNGGAGISFNEHPTVAAIQQICAAHARLGTTSVFVTLITDTPEITATALAAGAEAARENVPGFAGLHLEGPHLAVARKGAHDPDLIRAMTDDDVAILTAARHALPAMITTVAPEAVTPPQVRALCAAGIRVSIGHTDAPARIVQELVKAGASMITHLFNAMSQMTGREPGMVGTALNTGSLNVSLIADGFHVEPDCMAMALRAKQGPGRIFLISDAMSPVGSDITELFLNGRRITRTGGKLTLEDGTLAGADLDLATAVSVISQQVGVDLGEALRMASLYPADAVGLHDLGRLTMGGPASFIWLDSALRPKMAWTNGVAATGAAS